MRAVGRRLSIFSPSVRQMQNRRGLHFLMRSLPFRCPSVRPSVRSVRPFFLFLRVCSTDFDRMLHSRGIPTDRPTERESAFGPPGSFADWVSVQGNTALLHGAQFEWAPNTFMDSGIKALFAVSMLCTCETIEK